MKLPTLLAFGYLWLTAVLQSAEELERDTPSVECNQDLMRSYMLKGRAKSSKSDPNLICPTVKHNCCIKNDQQRAFHYVKNILPLRINEHKDRIKIAYEKLKKLHRLILRNQNNFVGSDRKLLFCRARRRKFETIDFDELDRKMNDFMDDFYHSRVSYYQRFYCAICDGWSHSTIQVKGSGADPSKPPVLSIDERSCHEYISLNEEAIRFWNVDILEYLKVLQDLVDCTHYSHSYNLTFYDEQVQLKANNAVECLRVINRDNKDNCKPLCEHLSFSNLMSWADGDSAFLTNTVNFFEKFYKNREVGEFISIEMRSFYRRFETLKSFTPIQENDFVNMVLQRTHPRVRPDDPLQVMNTGIREGGSRSGAAGRGLVQGESAALGDEGGNILADASVVEQTSRAGADGPAQTAVEGLSAEEAQLIPSLMPYPPAMRLLQGYNPAQKPTKQIRTPLAESNADLYRMYDQINASLKTDRDYIYRPFIRLLNLDTMEKHVTARDGLSLDKYLQTRFNLTETDFNRELFIYRKADKLVIRLETLIATFNPAFTKGIDGCIDTIYKISRANYQDDSPAARRLVLRHEGKTVTVKVRKGVKKN